MLYSCVLWCVCCHIQKLFILIIKKMPFTLCEKVNNCILLRKYFGLTCFFGLDEIAF